MSDLFSPVLRRNTATFYLWIGIVYWIHSYTAFAAMIQDLVILDELLKKGYDRRATPTNHYNSTSPTTAYVSIIVSSISSPSPLSMDYKTDLYLRQKWKDERLKHKDLKQPLDLSDPNLVKAIWKPEIYFPNAKEADFHFVTVPNVLVRIHPDGEILYMLRLRVTFSCMMDLSKFPLDRQKCTMEVASFSKTVEELLLEWVPENPVVTAPLRLTLFELDKIETKFCPESSGQIGNYSCLVAEFHLSRSLGFHLVQSYLPTILMVVISWVSFWMDVNSVPGRVTLGITTLLTVSSISTNIQENLPQASYVKAIDIWLGTCTAFVFLALLEFTFVNYLFRSGELRDWYREDEQYYRPYQISAEERGCSNTYPRPRHHNNMCTGAGMNGCQKLEQFRSSSSPHLPPTAPCTLVQQVLAQQEKEQDVGGGGKLSNHLEAQFIGASASPHSSLCDPSYPPVVGEDDMKSPSKDLLSERNKKKHRVQDPQAQARSIDETCRYAFPLAFAFFNCIYWPYYLLT